MMPNTEISQQPAEGLLKTPRLAFALATVLGVGYAPKAPGTFGSIVGIVVAILTHPVTYIVLFGVSFDLNVSIHDSYEYISPVFVLVPSVIAVIEIGRAHV